MGTRNPQELKTKNQLIAMTQNGSSKNIDTRKDATATQASNHDGDEVFAPHRQSQRRRMNDQLTATTSANSRSTITTELATTTCSTHNKTNPCGTNLAFKFLSPASVVLPSLFTVASEEWSTASSSQKHLRETRVNKVFFSCGGPCP